MTILGLDPRLQNIQPSSEDRARTRLIENIAETFALAVTAVLFLVSIAAIVIIACQLFARVAS